LYVVHLSLCSEVYADIWAQTTGIDLNIDNPNQPSGVCQPTLACRPDTYTPAPASVGACYLACPDVSSTGVALYDVWNEGGALECVYPYMADMTIWLYCRYDLVRPFL
jgi:hypothetical protein